MTKKLILLHSPNRNKNHRHPPTCCSCSCKNSNNNFEINKSSWIRKIRLFDICNRDAYLWVPTNRKLISYKGKYSNQRSSLIGLNATIEMLFMLIQIEMRRIRMLLLKSRTNIQSGRKARQLNLYKTTPPDTIKTPTITTHHQINNKFHKQAHK